MSEHSSAMRHLEPLRFLLDPDRGVWSRAGRVALIVAGLTVCWAITYLLGGARHVGLHWFYLPILIAAVGFGMRGALLAALGASVLAGPLMPLDVDAGWIQRWQIWVPRAGFFILIGILIAWLVGQLQEMTRRQLNLAAAERDLLARKAGVISTVSHEFRTPLTVIRGVTRTLDEGNYVTEQGQALLDGLRDAEQRLEDLVSAVLAAAEGGDAIDPPDLQPVVVRGVFDACGGQLANLRAQERVVLHTDPSAEVIASDPQILGHLLRLVIDNALRYSDPTSPVQVQVLRAHDRVVIEVQDQGPGFDRDFLSHAFDPFSRRDQTLARQSGGLGMGLLAASRLSQLLGGTISLENGSSRGARVRLSLPQPDRV
ncbi:MAG: HAMP domain-containing sensor histidine kinase [Actinomycetota bacterium]